MPDVRRRADAKMPAKMPDNRSRPMPLFQRRDKDARRAAAPTKPGLAIPQPGRLRIILAMVDNGTGEYPAPGSYYGGREVSSEDLTQTVRAILVREWGHMIGNTFDDLVSRASDTEFLDVIEAWFVAVERIATQIEAGSGAVYGEPGAWAAGLLERRAAPFCSTVNDVFDDLEIGWQMHGRQIVPRASMAMHATVIEPVLSLTNGEPQFAKVERAYRDALNELKPGGDPADAITDAGRAVQEMLEAAGAKGTALGPLLIDAKKRDLLGPYDAQLADAVGLIGDWMRQDRNTRGDTHHSGSANRDDAWLAVRVAGALILRLAAGGKR
jgi:hypothetical protein